MKKADGAGNATGARSRRRFLGDALACGAYLLGATAFAPAGARRAFAATRGGHPVRQESWGRLERIAEGVWALVSTPLADGPDARRTLCNGGIVRGRDGVLVVEGFASDEGASWMASMARELTGQPPTHVIVSHYHGDHCNGLGGFAAGTTRLLATAATRDLIEERSRVPVERRVLPSDRLDTELDLGGRRLRIEHADGHTPSDVWLRLEDPPVVWCGDLVWNGMFPNYVDALPTRLAASVRAIGIEEGVTYVPGHGAVARAAELRRYHDLLDDVEANARRAVQAGTPAAEAAAGYRLPSALAAWTLFSPAYFRVAFEAWERELVRR